MMENKDKLHPCLIVIFGASGDLTKRKLIPALFDLYTRKQMPEHFAIVGVSRTDFTDDDFRQKLYDFKPQTYADDAAWNTFAQHIHYHAADSTKLADFGEMKKRFKDLAQHHKTGENVLFYLSMAPQFFEPTIDNISAAEMVTEGKRYCSLDRQSKPWQRIVVEKPFGSDPKSATHLNSVLANVFEETEIYRIDHYLGKELVQNLMVLRFANAIFEPIWNQSYIDHVQITASETVGVETRGAYYDGPTGGAMRDMVQSHLLQVLSVMAMEPPVSLKAEDIRTEKIKIFKAMRVPKYDDVPNIAVRGQYGDGQLGGKVIKAYRDTDGVDPESQCDTYAAMKMYVDTWRWGGVPFYLRSGKAMAKKVTNIVLYFKPTPHILFRDMAKQRKANQIVINVQPDEGIRIRFEGKVPGHRLAVKDVELDFDYVKQWNAQPPDGYATLLYDVMLGDQTLFKHRDEIECAWHAVQPVLDYWNDNPQYDLPNYAAGTWGPSAADILMAQSNRYWHNPK
jgi:glucose-6-phosphate 1-dehydrogenase